MPVFLLLLPTITVMASSTNVVEQNAIEKVICPIGIFFILRSFQSEREFNVFIQKTT
jgi:hypothetical protein